MKKSECKNFRDNFGIKHLALALIFVFVVLGFSGLTEGNNPTEIYYLQDLDEIRNDLGGEFVLLRNLDFNDDGSYNQTDPDWETKKTAWTTESGWDPVGWDFAFEGTFDGQGYSISNLYINRGGNKLGRFFWLGRWCRNKKCKFFEC